ncbi:dihydrodipicolinate synthase family protein [Benzoatithermus flavus]|uniref:Dihydrodipicolinate synthase family protein n=1 Tax=Benzoatithermus flavus TaxID=3108223 RepID=A0ABU8XQN9_9PROT
MLTSDARGVYLIAATPFRETGELDLDGLDRLIDWYLGKGVDGLTILGQLGEAPKLTHGEALTVARRVLARVRAPVVVGVSSPGYASLVELTRAVMEAGAAGVMIAPPGTLRGDDAILAYCREVAERIGEAVPWVLQDFPLAGGPPMSASLVRRIADACPNMVVLKHEDWPGLDKITAIRRQEAEGARRLSILCGHGGIMLPHELFRGADGAMTGFSYPEMLVGVCRLAREGRHEEMLDLYDAYLPLVRYEQQPGLGLAVRKYVLWKRGALPTPALRAPAPKLSAETRAEVDWLLARLERRLGG